MLTWTTWKSSPDKLCIFDERSTQYVHLFAEILHFKVFVNAAFLNSTDNTLQTIIVLPYCGCTCDRCGFRTSDPRPAVSTETVEARDCKCDTGPSVLTWVWTTRSWGHWGRNPKKNWFNHETYFCTLHLLQIKSIDWHDLDFKCKKLISPLPETNCPPPLSTSGFPSLYKLYVSLVNYINFLNAEALRSIPF